MCQHCACVCVCVRVYVCVCTINRGIECDCVRESCGVKVYLTKQWGGSVIPTGGMVVLVLGGSGGGFYWVAGVVVIRYNCTTQ